MAPASSDPAVLEDLRAFARSCGPASLLRGSAGLSAVHGRSAVVWPTRDPFFPPRDGRRLAALLDTEVTWAPGAGTFVPFDRPDLVADAVVGVLSRDHLGSVNRESGVQQPGLAPDQRTRP
jgi:pimeloyl-ACP methyl ester carboxylesterase